MKYRVEFTNEALKQLKKLDPSIAALIIGWLRKNIDNCDNPRVHGKALSSNRKGQWRYRVGDYRILADIQDEKLVILVIDIGHRKDVYRD